MHTLKDKLGAILMVVVFSMYSIAAHSAMVSVELVQVDGDHWLADYSITNDAFDDPIEEFVIYYESGLYENLSVQSVPDNWDAFALDPDSLIGDSGLVDTYDLFGSGIALDQSLSGLSVAFDWLGSGSPIDHYFEIIDPVDFSVIDSGYSAFASKDVDVSPVPIPSSAALFLSAIAAMFCLRRFVNRS